MNDVNGNGMCDELEMVGCLDPEACNYASSATLASACNPKDCNGGCSGSDTGPYSTYWNEELKGDCCSFRDCFGNCADGKSDYPREDCANECDGGRTKTYVVVGTIYDASDCCVSDDRDCENVCNGEKNIDRLGNCRHPNQTDYCSENEDDDRYCDHAIPDETVDPCIRENNKNNLNTDGYDCAGECNGNNSNSYSDAEGNYFTKTDCCTDAKRDCMGVCDGTAVRLDAGDAGGAGECCDGIKTKTNQCCKNGDQEDANGDCCAGTAMGCDDVCNSGLTQDICGCGIGMPAGYCDCDKTKSLDAIQDCLVLDSPVRCTEDKDNDLICDHYRQGKTKDSCVRDLDLLHVNEATGLDCNGICNGGHILDNGIPPAQQCCLEIQMGCDRICNSKKIDDCAGECDGTAETNCRDDCITDTARNVEGYTALEDDNNDGTCNVDEIVDCNDPLACNYNEETTEEDERLCLYKNVDTSYTKDGESVNQDLRNFNCPSTPGELLSGGCIDENPYNGYCDEPYVGRNSETRGCSLRNFSQSSETPCTQAKSGQEMYVAANSVTIHDPEYCRFETEIKDCFGDCKSGDKDQDGICKEEDKCFTSNPCQNNATCEDTLGGRGMKCVCQDEWTGENCEERPQCTENHMSCLNGRVNTDLKVPNCQCICNAGFELNSEGTCVDTNECSPSDGSGNPCVHGSCTQTTTPGGYNCDCGNTGFSFDEDAKSCTICPAGYGWNGRENGASACVVCEFPQTQSSTIHTYKCEQQQCPGGKERVTFGSTELNPAVDNANCRSCSSTHSSPPGEEDCKEIECPANTMKRKSTEHLDQTLDHLHTDNCDFKTCEEYGHTCTFGTYIGTVSSNNCGCNCAGTGYSGAACETDVDECAPNPCHNGGTCTDKVNAYTCACAAGYSGAACETDVDDCAPNPCHNGGTCTDKVNAYTCDCAGTGYEDTTCETNIDECSTGTPCAANANCMDNSGAYTCSCKNGYDMEDGVCVDIKECADTPCNTNQNCIEEEGHSSEHPNGFDCECKPGYSGPACETDVDECAPNPCHNGGTCTDKVNAYTCACADGWTGFTCETDVDECSDDNNPCTSDQQCFNLVGDKDAVCEDKACKNSDLNCGSHGTNNGDVVFPDEPSAGWTDIDITRGTGGCNCDCSSGFAQQTTATSDHDAKSCTVCPKGSGYDPGTTSCAECAEETVNNQDTYTAECAALSCDAGYGQTTDASWNRTDTSTNSGNCVACTGSTTSPGGQGQCAEIACNPGYKLKPEAQLNRALSDTDQTNCAEVNECAPNPCHNGGTCTDEVNAYTCDCAGTGYEDTTCETNIDDCAPNPCHNGGTCTDEVNAFTCACADGYSGPTCETDVDECTPNPCHNGGTCTDKVNAYTCACADGWTGFTCETDVDECTPNPCHNGGTCTDKVNAYTCACADGWTGFTCETDVDECSDENNPCTSDQQCFNLVGDKDAVCEDKACKNSDLNCGSHGTNNGDVVFPDEPSAGWTDIDITRGTGGCNCDCSSGFAQQTTATSDHDAKSCTVCPKGSGYDPGTTSCAECAEETVNNQDTYTAECAALSCDAGYGQTTDASWNSTDTSTNSGNCVACTGSTTSPGGQGQCAEIACNPGYKLKPEAQLNRALSDTDQTNCAEVNECAPNPCHNGGTCTDEVNAYTCDCAGTGYEDTTCETNIDDCTPNPCHNGGTCTDKVNAFTCACASNGWMGTTCETDIEECTPNTCSTNEDCIEKDGHSSEYPYGFDCECKQGFTILNGACEQNAICEDSSCNSNGDCTSSGTAISCSCNGGWTGLYCNQDVVDCPADACGVHGTCTDGTNSYSCNCDSGYEETGPPKTCTSVDDCAPNPCHNGGTCTDEVNAFTCACAAGYSGAACETDVDECAPNPCHNGGTCTDKVNAFTCECAAGWTGNTCKEGVVDCPATSITVWISIGSETTPYYNFYTNEGCTQTLNTPEQLQAHTEYTFKRCSGSGDNHPFAVQTDGPNYSGSLTEGSELIISTGLPNTQFHWKCTSHQGMTGYFKAVQGVCVHGTCIEGTNSYSCGCDTGYSGTYCDTAVSCTKGANGANCLNGGIPTGDIPSGCGCDCEDTGYEGSNCENTVDHCNNVNCGEGKCVPENSGYTCQCYDGFGKENGVCTTCQAGWGWNEATGEESKCVECADTQANHLTTHSAPCAEQRCRPGYGVVQDSEFSHVQNWGDDDNDQNCEPCRNGKVSPGYSGVCVSISCPQNKIVINNYVNTLPHSDENNCKCRNDGDGDGICDEEEIQICTDASACNTADASTNGVHRDNKCYYAGRLNSDYELDMNLKHADCEGVCRTGFAKENGICTLPSSVKDTISAIRNSHANLVERQARFIEVSNILVARDERTETQAKKRYENRIEIQVDDLPGMPEDKKSKITSILQAKALKLKMVVAPCTTNPDTCVTNPTAKDDSCTTANLDDDVRSFDLTRYVMENVGCWQVFGTDDGPIAKQTKTSDGYAWACWESNAWSTNVTQGVGDEYSCNNRTFLTGSATDVTAYGCTQAKTDTKNCNHDPNATVDDGSCTHAVSGKNCDGTVNNASFICTVGGCTDNELVSAYQVVDGSGCDEQGGDHTNRDQCVTTGCNTTQLEAAFTTLLGQCF